MRKLGTILTLALALASPASAGEFLYLGRIVTAGTSVNNLSTATPFRIPPTATLTINCSAPVFMLVDNVTVTSGTGVPLLASTSYPITVGPRGLGHGTDAGLPTGLIAVIGTANCDVWQTRGVTTSSTTTSAAATTLGDSTATPGAATLNTYRGRSAFPADAGTVVITNSHVGVNSVIHATLASNDATLTGIVSVVPAAGSFTIRGNASAFATTNVCWSVVP